MSNLEKACKELEKKEVSHLILHRIGEEDAGIAAHGPVEDIASLLLWAITEHPDLRAAVEIALGAYQANNQ